MSIFSFVKNLFTRTQNNAFLHQTFDHMLEGIQIHDFNWRYIYVNNALISYSQYSKEELLGYTLMEKYPGIENTALFNVLEQCMIKRKSEHFETEFFFPDGSKADFELSIQPVPEGLFILSINITERKRAQERQRTSETYYHSVIEQANDTIYIVDSSARPKFIDINESGCRLLGYTKEEIVQLTIFDIIFESEFADSESKMNDLRSGKSLRRDRKLKRKDGSTVDAELSAKKMEDGNIMVVARDISERKKAEAQLAANEKRFRALVENNYDILSLLDESYKVIYRSPSATRIMGFTSKEMETLEGLDKVHPEDKEYAAAIMREATKNPAKQIHATFRRQHKDGHYVWLEGVITNLLHDQIKAFVTNFRDITSEKETEQKLKTSELYYRSIIEQANDMIYITDASLTQKFIDINPGGCQMLGYTKEEFLKLKPTDIIFEEDLSKNPIKLEQLQSGVAIRNERRLKRKDGTAVETESSGKMSADGNFIVFARDITERKKAEREIRLLNENLEKMVVERTIELEYIIAQLKESEEKFQKAFDTGAAGIAITSLQDTNYMDVNRAFIQMTGFSKEEIIGHNSRELGMIINIAKREQILKEIRKQGFARNFEMTIRHKAGKEFEILASVETIILKGEKCALNIIHDITERKRAEEQLILVNKELEAFTYSVSHDLRAPLRAINGYAEILREDHGPQFNEEGNRILKSITYNAIKMGNLIDDLLAFSKLGRQEVQKEQIDLHELLETIILELNKNQKHKATIKIGTLHKVKADYSLLYQVIFNLVSNGLKYSSKRADAEIEIHSVEQNGEIIFSVKDNGAGFDMKFANKLFGVFQRLHSQEEFEGTGVGLAIVQRIIAKHNGKVWAEGKLNEGAIFSFSLPVTDAI
jgi:PAS domain S-box-containing protein